MPLYCTFATASDAARIAEIHMAAFKSNLMLRAQFPSDATRCALQKSIEMKALVDIQDPNITVLVVHDDVDDIYEKALNGKLAPASSLVVAPIMQSSGAVIGFAKWSHPAQSEDPYQETPWVWPEGTELDILGDWIRVAGEAYEAAVGAEPCYVLSFIATDPQLTGKGAGSLMVAWGLEQCQKHNIHAYLESTVDAVPFYKKLGFESVVDIHLDISSQLDEGHAVRQVYKEVGMVYRPKGSQEPAVNNRQI